MAGAIPIIKQDGVMIDSAYIESTITIGLYDINYDYDIFAELGGEYFVIATKVKMSYEWKLPTSLCELLPNSTEGKLTIRVDSYNGNYVGTNTVTITAKVPEDITPSIVGIAYTEAVEGIADKFGGFVQDNSIVNVKINASGQYGASIVRYETEFLGRSYTGNDFNTEVVTSSGKIPVKTTITDSRGRFISVTNEITVLEYSFPKIGDLKAYRCTSNGTVSDEGEYVKVVYEYTVNVMDNNNEGEYAISYSIADDDESTVLTSGIGTAYAGTYVSAKAVLLAEYPYTIVLTVSDYFKTVKYEVDVPVGFMIMDVNDNGRAVAFGKASEKDNGIEFFMDIYDKHDTQIRNGLMFYESGGTTDANTTIEELFLSAKNTPTTGFWCVRQMFYEAKSPTASRVQIAYPHGGIGSSNYRRTYIKESGWTKWYESPIIVEEGTSGIWTYRKWSDGRAEALGKISLNSISVNTALGGWYRSDIINGASYPYPFTFKSVTNVNVQYLTTNNNGGLVWLTNQGTTTAPPNSYVIRPTTATSVSGEIHIRAEGTF